MRRWSMFCAATVPNESNTPATIIPRSTGQKIGVRPTMAKPAAIAPLPPTTAACSNRRARRTPRIAPDDAAAVPEHRDQAVAERPHAEVVGEHDLGHDHGADADHDQRPGERQPAHPAVGHELAVAVHAAADLLVAVGVERRADPDHEQRGDGHHGGRDDEDARRGGHGQQRAADAGAEHVAGASERPGEAVGAGQLLVGDQVRHGALDGRRERALGAAGGDHDEDRREHVAVPDEQRAGGEADGRQARPRSMITQRRSWRSPACPVHGETAVAAPKIASIAPDSHQADPVAA